MRDAGTDVKREPRTETTHSFSCGVVRTAHGASYQIRVIAFVLTRVTCGPICRHRLPFGKLRVNSAWNFTFMRIPIVSLLVAKQSEYVLIEFLAAAGQNKRVSLAFTS
jgi:hypothetical protein